MPDSPSIPTGWPGLPRGKARRPLSFHSGLGPHAPSSRRHSRSKITRTASLSIAGVLMVLFVAWLLLTPFDHDSHGSEEESGHLDRLKNASHDVWSALLFEEEEQDKAETDREPLWTGIDDADGASEARAPSQVVLSSEASYSQQLCSERIANTSTAARYKHVPGPLRRSMLYAGSGDDVSRILGHAADMSKQWQARRDSNAAGSEVDAFRVLVLGGSVSNCRGVERADCWHSHVMSWFAKVFPLGDPRDRSQVSYRLIDLAKSATGSVFFRYCWKSELMLRKKDTPYFWGEGPDLVIIETGINDVVTPSDFTSKRTSQSYRGDFESLLWQLKSLPSRPAIIVLDAPSKLLAKLQRFDASPEFAYHLPPSVWLDVPVISGKTALQSPIGMADMQRLGDLFLSDGHHPNVAGHKLLADFVTSYLEQIVCDRVVTGSPEGIDGSMNTGRDASSLDILGMPDRYGDGQNGECIQVGAVGEKRRARRKKGWERLYTSRDKQYLTTSTYSSKVTYDVEVGKGGQILLSWLKSRFNNLGEARVTLDNRKPGVKITGHWELGWSIGVPTVIFENVPSGSHSVTVELLQSRNDPSTTQNSFKLIAIATT